MQPVKVDVRDIAAEQLSCGGFERVQPFSCGIHQSGAARIVTITDEAVRAYWTDMHNLAEGAGATSLAALLPERDRVASRRVGVVITGGNIELELFRQWLLDSGP